MALDPPTTLSYLGGALVMIIGVLAPLAYVLITNDKRFKVLMRPRSS